MRCMCCDSFGKMNFLSKFKNSVLADGIFRRHYKAFKDIPGPKPLPLIGNMHLFFPFGPYKLDRLNDAATDLNKRFGPIVRLKLGKEIVFLFEPSNIEKVFRNEGKQPKRPLFEALLKYRKGNIDKYNHMGLFTDNGDGWSYMRRLVNPMLRSEVTKVYLSEQCTVADDFVNYLKIQSNDNNEIQDMLHHLYKYTQEAIGVICFGKRLQCFGKGSASGNKINKNVALTLDAMGKTLLQMPLWEVFPTPTYRSLVKSQDELFKITDQLVKDAAQSFERNPGIMNKEQPFLSSLLSNTDLDKRDLNLILLEMFQAGIDATASTIAMTMYHLSRNFKAQEELIAELDRVAPTGTMITYDMLSSLKYMRMCIKETFRLTPPTGGSARLLNSTMVLSNYEVPIGTLVVGMHPVMSCNEDFVQSPMEYEPKRWSRWEGIKPAVPPFVSLPFGFGTRACPGKQIAEQEIMLFLIMFFKKFWCKYNGKDVRTIMRLNYLPDKPLQFTLIERNGRERSS